MAVLYVPAAPWCCMQYLLSVASRFDQLDPALHGPLALDLAAAKWATSVLLDDGASSWPGRWHVLEASDVVRNLLLVGVGARGLLQAVTLTQRGYPWPNFKAPDNLRRSFASVKRAYARALVEFDVRASSLEETVLPADLARMKVLSGKWASIIGNVNRVH